MRYIVPRSNWTYALGQFIEQSVDGDEIEVASFAAKALAEQAKQRMCPDKNITFVVAANTERDADAANGMR